MHLHTYMPSPVSAYQKELMCPSFTRNAYIKKMQGIKINFKNVKQYELQESRSFARER